MGLPRFHLSSCTALVFCFKGRIVTMYSSLVVTVIASIFLVHECQAVRPLFMRRQNEISDECNEMVQKVNDVWKHIEADAETLCGIGHSVDTLFGIDITDAQVRQDLICAVMDNSDSFDDLFNKMDETGGWINKLLRLGYNAAIALTPVSEVNI